MRTGEVASEAGVNVQTLRYYERRGLLPEPRRRESGYRVYGRDAVEIVRFIKRAQELGFTLDEIETLFDFMAGGPDDCEQVRQLALGRIDQLERAIADLQAIRDSLNQLVATCHLPRHERRCPLLAALGCDPSCCDFEERTGNHDQPNR